jgi:hypothetical protein
MWIRWIAVALGALLVTTGGLLLALRPDRAIRVATASISATLCVEVFMSGIAPERVFAEEIEPQRALRMLLKRVHYRVDARHEQVVTDWAGHFAMTSRNRPRLGCGITRAVPAAADWDAP